MTELLIRPNPFPIPEAAFNEDAVICAKKGSGKTVLGKGIAERGLDAGERTCIIDPKGDWYGLKSSADGESAGYPVAVFGGDYADMTFSADTAVPLARLLGSENVPAIIDTSRMTLSGRAVALNAFLRELYNVNRDSLALFLDEVHQIAPQNPHGSDAYALRETISTIVTLGRQKGFRVTSICQRVALVDKTLISQANTMIAMRLTQKHDRTPVLGWFGDNAPDDFTTKAKDEIGKLTQGEAFVGDVDSEWFERVRVGMNSTFDSSATPGRTGSRKTPKTLADVDLSGIKAALEPKPKSTSKASEDNEQEVVSKDVRRMIAAAEKRGRESARAEAEGRDTAAHEAGYLKGYKAGANDVYSAVQAHVERFRVTISEVATTNDAPVSPMHREAVKLLEPKVLQKGSQTIEPARNTESFVLLSAPEEKVLEALSFWNAYGFDSPTRAQIGFVAGYSPKSGNFSNILSKLRTKGFVEYPSGGTVRQVEEQGLSVIPLLSEMIARLSSPQQSVLKQLLTGDVMTREELGQVTGYSPTSGNFSNLLSSLRSLSLIDYPKKGHVAAEPWLVKLA